MIEIFFFLKLLLILLCLRSFVIRGTYSQISVYLCRWPTSDLELLFYIFIFFSTLKLAVAAKRVYLVIATLTRTLWWNPNEKKKWYTQKYIYQIITAIIWTRYDTSFSILNDWICEWFVWKIIIKIYSFYNDDKMMKLIA